MSYGMPAGSNSGGYGGTGVKFPDWVNKLASQFGLKPSTYPGHQESDRPDIGSAPNPAGLNRGIDWMGTPDAMLKFARAMVAAGPARQPGKYGPPGLEMVIYQDPRNGTWVWYPEWVNYDSDFGNHTNHVHTRHSEAMSLPGTPSAGQEKAVGYQGDPVWLEDVLREALGNRLVVIDGWQDRGTGGFMGDIWGVMIHHTGNSRERVEVIRDGRPDLAGPLSQGLITPDGKFHLIAVGPCNHAGLGSYPGLGTNNGNQRTIGFECAWPTIRKDGSFDENERWPDAQIITMRDASAAVVKRLGYDGSRVIGHKTYAGAVQGKWDPGNLDIPWFQGEVNKALRGDFKTPPAGPPVVIAPPPTLPKPSNPRADRVLLEEAWDQLRGPTGEGWPQLGGKSLVDSLAEAHRKLDLVLSLLQTKKAD